MAGFSVESMGSNVQLSVHNTLDIKNNHSRWLDHLRRILKVLTRLKWEPELWYFSRTIYLHRELSRSVNASGLSEACSL